MYLLFVVCLGLVSWCLGVCDCVTLLWFVSFVGGCLVFVCLLVGLVWFVGACVLVLVLVSWLGCCCLVA